jgi:NADH-quinone oxidoreductase subunit G
MAIVYVNDKPVEIGAQRLNCVQAAEKAGVLIPHYCWHPALTVVASCRMCLVEVGELKDGKVQIPPKVVPGCQTPVKDGSVIVTAEYAKRGPDVKPLPYPDKFVPGRLAAKAQADTLEGILLNHPLDCPVCDKAGECKLQDYSFQFGRARTRMVDDKNTPPNKPELGPTIALFTDRCVMCSRCVRFTREISGTAELQVINRGHHAEIDVFPGEPLDNPLAGNVVDLCPVGALGSKDFLYTQRVWYLKTHDSVCPGCSTGCSIHVDTNKDVLFRLRPRENPQSQGYFMCDEGRHGAHYVNSKERLDRSLLRVSDALAPALWPNVAEHLQLDFATAAEREPESTWLALSPFLTCEEAFLAAKWFKGLSPNVKLALGFVPMVGADDTYPKDRRGQPLPTVKFTIRAEKCPNRRGVEEVLKQFQGEVIPFGRLVENVKNGAAKAVFLTAGYPNPKWLGELGGGEFGPPLLATCDLFAGPATKLAKYVIPAAAFAEKEGTYVNHAGLAQRLKRCVKPPRECRTEGQLFFDLLGRRGLVPMDDVRREMAAEVAFFAPLANGIGDLGTNLTNGRHA